jgi:hypothetical protein
MAMMTGLGARGAQVEGRWMIRAVTRAMDIGSWGWMLLSGGYGLRRYLASASRIFSTVALGAVVGACALRRVPSL